MNLITKNCFALATLTLMLAGRAEAQEWIAKDEKERLKTLSHAAGDTARFAVEGSPSLTFSQAHYSDSWKDGLGSIGFRAAFLGSTTYTHDRIFFKNSLDAAYARSKEGEATRSLKKEDRLNFNSVLGYQMNARTPLYWVGQLDLKTQFDVGENADHQPVSHIFSPAYIIASLGARYQSDYGLSVALAPVSGRFTVVADTAYAKFVDVDLADHPRHFRAQLGAYCQLAFDKKITKMFHVKSTLELFSNYQDNPQNIDVDWITTLSFDLNRFFSILLFNRIIYRDKDRYTVQSGHQADGTPLFVTKGPALQWAESLNFGVSYRFGVSRKKI
jgi:hypothetical protein